jgi:hypothetical protein
MYDSLELEGRTIDWTEIFAAYQEQLVPGLTIFFARPPFVGFVSGRDSRYPIVLKALQGQGLLKSPTEASRLLDEMIRPQLSDAIASRFAHPEEAQAVLDTTILGGHPLSPRLALAVVELSGGDLSQLHHWCAETQVDYRDVYMAAWYRK